MAMLSRVDLDVDMPHLQLEDEPTLVNARPSREFRAMDDTSADDMPSRAAWFGKLLFVGTMVSIIAAATVTAVRENAEEPWLAPWLYTAKQILPLTSEPDEAALALAETASQEPALVEETTAQAAPKTAAQPAAPIAGLAEPSERMLLPEVVFMNPEPTVANEPALSARPNKARLSRGRKLKPARAKVSALGKAQPAMAASPELWEKARDTARTAYAAGRYRDALVAYEQAARSNPRHGLTLAGLAAARMQVGDSAGAVDAYKRAVATAPTNLTFQLGLARAYANAGDDARARETYQRVLKLDRNNVAAQAGLERL